jgi:membrane-bound transcription factor site-1 protease
MSITHHHSFFISLFLLFITLFQTLSPNPSSPPPNYIVGFLHYDSADHHRAYLESTLGSDGWRWIPRRNPASKYPTDFALVSIYDLGVVDEIRKLGSVKYVSLDMSYKRGLMNDQRDEDKVGAFADGEKRPGKIFTKMSFCEAEEQHPTNRSDSFKWGRELLMQVKIFRFLLLGI